MRLALCLGLVLWAGTTLVLSRVRWFARPSLADRLSPYGPISVEPSAARSVLSGASFRESLRPLAVLAGEVLGRLLDREDLATRLRRVHHALDPATFRVRQAGRSTGALLGALIVVAVVQLPPAIAALAILGAPALAFLLVEQGLQRHTRRRQQHVQDQLPVVAEQLAMLLASGWSVFGALSRVSTRSAGPVAEDIAAVCGRVRQGLVEGAALLEWAELSGVPAVDRLVGVLALNRHTADLGRLLSEEARAIRDEHHRTLLESIDKRAQQVWIPVTVATLVPGALFIAIPFIEALRLFTAT